MKFLAGTKLNAKFGDKVEVGEVLGEEVDEITQKVDMSAELSKLSPKKLTEFNLKVGVNVNQGEVLLIGDGWFGKKILAPMSGKIVSIDEFFNVEFSQGANKVRRIISPVTGKVVKKEVDSLTIEFGATEIDGEGIGAGKVWADGLVLANNISDIGQNCKNKIIFLQKPTTLLVTKIEAVGGVGLVTKDVRIESRLPVLVIIEMINATEKRVLLNTTGGRLLIVE